MNHKNSVKISAQIALIVLLATSCGGGDEDSMPSLQNNLNQNGNSMSSSADPMRIDLDAMVSADQSVRQAMSSEAGWMNPTGKRILVNGRVQLSGVTASCKSADLEVKRMDGKFIRINHFFVEGTGVTTGRGNGMSFPVSFRLNPGSSFRIVENTNSDCRHGGIFLGGDAQPSNRDMSEIYDWSYTLD